MFVLDLIRQLQDILDRKSPAPVTDSVLSSDDDSELESEDSGSDEEDGSPLLTNTNYQKAQEELRLFESYKMKSYRPTLDRSKSKILAGEDENGKMYEIVLGPVLTNGKDLPSGRNLGNYIDSKGRIDLLRFFIDHQFIFPTLFVKCQSEAAQKIVEVGCERFFAVSGYVSAPRRTRLGVRTYERLAMLAKILSKVYVDKEWVAKEYLRRCKEGAWKKENTVEAVKCWNLERMLDAELLGKPKPSELTLDDLLNEGSSSADQDNTGTDDEIVDLVE